MSWTPAAGSGAGNPHDGSQYMGGGGDMAMMDGSVNVNMLDMDMSLPTDLDMELTVSQATADPSYRPQAMNGDTSPMNTRDLSRMASSDVTPNHSSTPMQQDANMTGAGAGPLPTGFGMPAQGGTSTLTEFTKRRNWSQRIIEELKDFLHILTPDGRILYVSPSCKSITGYDPHSLIGKFIGEYVHPDDSGIFMREFNESIASGNTLRFFYRFKKDDGTYIIFECDGHPHIAPEPNQSNFNPNANNSVPPPAGVCRGFFMMARPYPTRNAALLDSFLEHKIDNERLMKRIEELKREEVEENAEQVYREGASTTGLTASESQAAQSRATGDAPSDAAVAATPNYQGMPPPAKPPISNTALTRQNLDSALSAQKPDSIADKMSRYEANSTHLESIELLTGLRYRDGERSHGISTGDTSPALIRGDAGIAILLDRDRDGNKKEKKKARVADEYVCADCGTLDSPEWRKGPKGPKTLCNACGLRWAKKEKKRSGDDTGKVSSPTGMQQPLQLPHQQQMPPQMQPQQPMHGLPGVPMMPGVHPPGLPMQNSTGSSSM